MFNHDIEKHRDNIAKQHLGAGAVARIKSDDDVTLKNARKSALILLDALVTSAESKEVGVVLTTPNHFVSVRGNKLQELLKEWKVKL